MDAPCRTRPATPADAPPLARLERVAFTDPWSESSLREVLASSGAFGLIAERDGEVAGYVLARVVADEGEILNLAVAPAHRRRGIARALLELVLRQFAARQVGQVFLEVRESNAAALELYRRQGFESAGRRAGYYHRPEEAALVLRRVVDRSA